MLKTIEDIERKILSGEDSTVEFEEISLSPKGVRLPNTEAIEGGMVAFANAGGGTILLGVNDDGLVQGLPDDRLRDI